VILFGEGGVCLDVSIFSLSIAVLKFRGNGMLGFIVRSYDLGDIYSGNLIDFFLRVFDQSHLITVVLMAFQEFIGVVRLHLTSCFSRVEKRAISAYRIVFAALSQYSSTF